MNNKIGLIKYLEAANVFKRQSDNIIANEWNTAKISLNSSDN